MSDDFLQFFKDQGKCCACEGSLEDSKYVNMGGLNKKATWELPYFINLLVRDKYPEKRAVALVCDNCVAKKQLPRLAVEWDKNNENIKYHPVDELEDLPEIPEIPEREVIEAEQRLYGRGGYDF